MLLRSHSINADDTESELAAIPESPKSDSTLHGSSGGSLGELEDTVPRNAFLQEPRMSIISNGTSVVVEPNNRNFNRPRTESITKPIWFLGNESDESYQVIILLIINRDRITSSIMLDFRTLFTNHHKISLRTLEK